MDRSVRPRAGTEGGRRTEHAQRFVGILHAGQLHDDAVEALAGDDRLRDAEFVHAIAQRGDVLLDREVLPLLDLRRAQTDRDGSALAEGVRVNGQVRVLLAQQARKPLRVVATAQTDPDRVDAVAGHAGERNAFLAQHRAVVALHAREQLLHSPLRVDFVHEVDAAAQVEAEAHWLESQRTHPARRAGHVGQRHEIFFCGALLHDIACFEPRAHVVKRRTSRSPSRYEFSTVTSLDCSSETTCWSWASVTAVRSLRESCSAGASPNTFGRASTVPRRR